jgi:hypothetical protein
MLNYITVNYSTLQRPLISMEMLMSSYASVRKQTPQPLAPASFSSSFHIIIQVNPRLVSRIRLRHVHEGLWKLRDPASYQAR